MSKATMCFTVELAIHEGQLEAFDRIAQARIAGSQQQPGTLGYP